MTYGTTFAPLLATRCLNQLAIDKAIEYPLAAKIIFRDFYVDDLITGCDTVDEANRRFHETTQLFKKRRLSIKEIESKW